MGNSYCKVMQNSLTTTIERHRSQHPSLLSSCEWRQAFPSASTFQHSFTL